MLSIKVLEEEKDILPRMNAVGELMELTSTNNAESCSNRQKIAVDLPTNNRSHGSATREYISLSPFELEFVDISQSQPLDLRDIYH